MTNRQNISANTARTMTVRAVAVGLLAVGLLFCPEASADVGQGRTDVGVSSFTSGPAFTSMSRVDNIIGYQCQHDLFGPGAQPEPLVVDRNQPATKNKQQTRLPLLSIPANGSEAGDEEAKATGGDSKLLNADQPSLSDLADTLQWTILLLAGAATIVVGLHKFSKQKQFSRTNTQMEYMGTLPVRGQFSMHLVTITNRLFLVTTDRTGVKTVNALNEWDQFTSPFDLSPDDPLFSEQLSAATDSKTNHHG